MMVMQKILIKMGYQIEEVFGAECAKQGLAFSDVQKPIINRLKHYWAE